MMPITLPARRWWSMAVTPYRLRCARVDFRLMNHASPNSRVPRSMELYRRALQLIPGGTQLVSRRPTRFANGVSPAYAVRAQGARFWDVDGHEYIDWVSGI